MRQVMAGRVKETPDDLRDIAVAVVNGDFDALTSVLSQRGENVSPDVSGTVAASDTSGDTTLPTVVSGALLAECVKLGSAARGYRLGATGPDYYDCSGLVWRAMKNLGMYEGPRFTTSTFVRAVGNTFSQVQSPSSGDIVLWSGKHIGVVSGPDKMYSAMSPSSGIGYGSISGSNGYFGRTATFYRTTNQGGN